MDYHIVPVDSDVLGAVVLSLENVSAESDIAATEAQFIREHAPSYVSCRVPLDNTATLLALQANGFRFVETQLKAAVEPQREFDVSGYPYGFERVGTDADLEAVVRIATAAIRHDRFSIDPEMPRWFLTPSPNLEPGLVRESSCPSWGLKGFSDEKATQHRADRGPTSAG